MTETKLQTQEIEQAEQEVNFEAVQKFLIQSFRHSQQDPTLQERLFHFFAQLHPTYSLTEEDEKKLADSLPSIAYKLLGHAIESETAPLISHRFINAEKTFEERQTKIQKEIEKQLELFSKITKEKPENKNDELLQFKLLAALLMRDLHYVVNGRPGRDLNNVNPSNPQEDAYLSYFYYHGLEGHSTGIDDYDKFYETTINALSSILDMEDKSEYEDVLVEILTLIEEYHKKHPQQQISKHVQELHEKLKNLGFEALETSFD